MQRYGVDNAMKSDAVRRRMRKTMLERHGVQYTLQSKTLHRKAVDSFIRRYGVDNPMKDDTVQARARQTCLERYGVDHPSKTDDFYDKIDWKLTAAKCHMTMKKNGTYGKSRAEDEFFSLLCSNFGTENVERQARINGWSIDFHIKHIDVYIQFDGVYWHGLDRPIEVIAESTRTRDKTIYATWQRDREQDKWFKENHLSLLRCTDKEDPDQFIAGLHDLRG